MHYSLHFFMADSVLLQFLSKIQKLNKICSFCFLCVFRPPSAELIQNTGSYITYCLFRLKERHKSIRVVTRLSDEPFRNSGFIYSWDKRAFLLECVPLPNSSSTVTIKWKADEVFSRPPSCCFTQYQNTTLLKPAHFSKLCCPIC